MKTKIALFAGLLITISFSSIAEKINPAGNTTGGNTVNLATSPDLMPLVNNLLSAYRESHPDIRINLEQVPAKQGFNSFERGADLIIGGSESVPKPDKSAMWSIVIGRDIIVPVMNSSNPMSEVIARKGISPSAFARIVTSGSGLNWGVVLDNGSTLPIHYYRIQDATIDQHIGRFIQSDGQGLNGIEAGNGNELVMAIQKDPMAIGFCKLADLTAMSGQVLTDKVSLVPIDKNGDGKIDFMEDIYGDLNEFNRGVWIGKYPKSLTGNIYAFAPVRPEKAAAAAFLDWVLTDGQNLLQNYGLCDLVSSERNTQLAKLNPSPAVIREAGPEKDRYAILLRILIVVSGFILLGLLVDFAGKYFHGRRKTGDVSIPGTSGEFAEDSVVIPKGLYYDKTHTWAFLEKDGSARIGIADFLQHVTGTITRIEMKNPGEKVRKGEVLATLIQRGKRLNIKSPVTGTVTAQNTGLHSDPSRLNHAPYAEGWICLVDPVNWSLESRFLSAADHYQDMMKKEFVRLKDFFAGIMSEGKTAYATIALQDGGIFRDHVLEDFGPEVWEDFESAFLGRE